MSYCSQSPIKKKRSVLATCKMKSRNVTEQQHPSALSVHDVQNPNEIPEAFYTQQNHPRFYTRNLERIRTKKGKTTCIGVIAKSLKLEVLKWEQMCSLEITEYGEDRYLKEETEIDSLLRFIRTSKTTVKSKTGKMENKGVVYHIDELPLSAYFLSIIGRFALKFGVLRDVERFRRIIYPYLLLNKSFIVFDLTTRDSSWFFSPKRVFSSYFINDLNITELEFYPVSSTFMRKGDMCRAINTIHYSLMCTRDNFSVPPIFEVASYDELFHMLGVLLYAKRNDFPSNLDLQSTVREELQRPPFTRDINDVLDMSKVSPDIASSSSLRILSFSLCM
ncbi:hypothetical protein DICVIV_09328 [Dictyocaulus viviparus]|uniref:Uncharacterized protein n=1 Tax=Dictyocaulus viviparus TaxID=29172 RepID=A0A0D8XJ29_DICVI|nr:hypothetical protein DICVIV_09328 [Dictyocaulus viviparus]